MKKTGSTVTPPDFSGLSVHLCCNEQSATGGQAGNVGRVKTNGKRGSAVVLLFEGSAYMRFSEFSWDASIASLTDTAASDQIAFVMLKSPDGMLYHHPSGWYLYAAPFFRRLKPTAREDRHFSFYLNAVLTRNSLG